MSTPAIIILVVIFVMLDITFVAALLYSATTDTVKPLCDRYPPQPVGELAVRKRYQSFKFGLLNFGWCIHVAVDEQYLHLQPVGMARWIGCRAMSIPWKDIRVVGKPFFGSIKTEVGMITVHGPVWCMKLAAPNAGDEPPAADGV